MTTLPITRLASVLMITFLLMNGNNVQPRAQYENPHDRAIKAVSDSCSVVANQGTKDQYAVLPFDCTRVILPYG